MDEINAVIIKALQFLHAVQTCCDQQRQALENHFKSEISKHAEEICQKEQEKEEKLEQEESFAKSSQEEEPENSDCEELELADKLLRKARYIREKYKIPNLDSGENLVNEVSSSSEDCSSGAECKNSNYRTEFKVRQSHSAPLMLKAGTMPPRTRTASQSAKGRRLPRAPNIQSCSESNIPVRAGKKLSQRSCPVSDYVVVTQEEYRKFRNLKGEVTELINSISACTTKSSKTTTKSTMNQNDKVAKMSSGKPGGHTNWKKKIQSAKSVYASTTVQKQPSVSVRQVLRSCSDIPFGNNELKINFFNYLWYPFISSANKTRLTVRVTCQNVEEFRTIITLCHKIQEAMFWIDIFSLIGSEVATALQGKDQSDPKFAIVISYMQSIFHERLQRVPVIVEKLCSVQENRIPRFLK